MSDERLVEVMAEGMHNANHCPSDGPGTWLPEAHAALAALRDAGFQVYRQMEPCCDPPCRNTQLRAMSYLELMDAAINAEAELAMAEWELTHADSGGLG